MPEPIYNPRMEKDGPRRVPMNVKDRENGTYSIPQLQMALEGLHQDGMVVLQGLVTVDHCDAVYEHMTQDRDRILRERHAGSKVYNQVSHMEVFPDSHSAGLTRFIGCQVKHPPSSSIHQPGPAF